MRSITGWQTAVLVGAFLAAGNSIAQAQTRSPVQAARHHESGATLAAEIGMYFPVGPLVMDSTVVMRGVGSIKFGARLTLPLTSWFALETGLGWSPSMVAQRDYKQTRDLQSNVLQGSVRTRLRLTSESDEGLELFASPGLGLVHRSGSAWSGMTGTTDAALVVGGGVRFAQMNSRLSFSATIEDYITHAQFTGPGGYHFNGQLHNEIVFAVAANFVVAGR